MARQRKTIEAERQRFEDDFYDLSASDQSALLQTLATLHRLKLRQKADPTKSEPIPAAVAAESEASGSIF